MDNLPHLKELIFGKRYNRDVPVETAKHSLRLSCGQMTGSHTDAFYPDPACLFLPRILQTYGCGQRSAVPLEAMVAVLSSVAHNSVKSSKEAYPRPFAERLCELVRIYKLHRETRTEK